MTDHATGLQSALYQYLTDNLGTPVYDFVPESTAYPYVTIDYQEAINSDFLSNRKDERIIYFSIWSDYRGQKEVMEIMSEMDDLLNQNYTIVDSVINPTIQDWYDYFTSGYGRIAQIKVLSKRTNREPDGLTYMGQLRLKVLLER